MNWFQKISIRLNPSPVDPQEKKKWDIIGLVRGHLEGTPRFSTKPILYHTINDVIPLDASLFLDIIDEMISRGFLEAFAHEGEEAFRWAADSPEFPGNQPL